MLDNQSEVSIFCNKYLVKNIRKAEVPIHIEGIAKDKLTVCDTIADTESFGTVYFCESATANIISLANTQHLLSIDLVKNSKGNITAFKATCKSTDRAFMFQARSGGLFTYTGIRVADHGRTYVNTVKQNKTFFSKKEVRRADKALLYRSRLCYPSIAEYKRMVFNGVLKDFDITTKDIDTMEKIYGKAYADAAGKSTYIPTPNPEHDTIPDLAAAFVGQMKSEPLKLYGDIFFVDRVAFLLTVSRPLNYVICTYLKQRSWKCIFEAIATHKNTYVEHGYNVGTLRFDREKGVVCLRDHLLNKLGITLDTAAPYQKIPVAERKIRLVKERMRAEINNLGYRINRTMLAYLPKYVARRLNSTTSRIISINVSPMELLTGRKVSVKHELKVGFGEYAYVHHTGNSLTNSINSRAKIGVCIGLTHNLETSAMFYDVTKPSNQTPMIADNYEVAPMPEQIVSYMNDLADSKAVIFSEENMDVEDDAEAISAEVDGPSVPTTGESDTIADLLPDDIPENFTSHDTADTVEITIEDNAPLREDFTEDLTVEGSPYEDDDTDDDINQYIESLALRGEIRGVRGDNTESNNANPNPNVDADQFIRSILNQPTPTTTSPTDPNPNSNSNSNPNPQPERVTRSMSGVSMKKAAYAVTKVEMMKVICSRSYHISMKRGIQTYGDKAKESIFAEVEAMEKKGVFTPVHFKDLTHKQKTKAIRSFMFMKEKKKPDGSFDKLKSRLTANGKSQNREEVEMMFGNTSSPTIAFSSLLSIIAIAKAEGRKMATVDIKNAYLNADLSSEGLVLVIDATVAAEYLKLRPDAAQYLNAKGELYCLLNKALYGTVEGAKAWYDDIADFLKHNGFTPNSSDSCVFNVDIDGTQMTIGVYVDDLYITCESEELIDYFHQALLDEYTEVSFSKEIKLDYLGMVIDSNNKDFVEISMPSYVQSVIDDLDVKENETSDSPAAVDLFNIKTNDVRLGGDEKDKFHTMVAKILYLAKHARPDLLLASTFLCTRVQCPGKDDWKKLKRIGRYLNGSKDLFLRIGNDCVDVNNNKENTVNVNVYVDASFAVHDTMRSHTGAIISIGGVPVFYKSSKQGLNANSSTQAEIIGISQILPQAVSTAEFIKEQMNRKVNVNFYEDNKSTIAMMKNGRPKAENTRHINIRYFLIHDYMERGEIDLQYVATDEQHGDYFTKPLQGQSFKYHRNYIMGHINGN